MIIGDVPLRKGSAYGPGLTHDEAMAHMSMWVMAASPLLTCTDVRNMTAETKAILTNAEVLHIHKDPLVKMATRVDVGGGTHELHSSNLCSTAYPACQEGPGDPGYPGHTCLECRSNSSVYEKPLHDGSSAVMVLNRGSVALNVSVQLEDLSDSTRDTWTARDVWAHADLGTFSKAFTVAVPAHGVRLLRMHPYVPPPPPPPPPCPPGWAPHDPGFWSNPSPVCADRLCNTRGSGCEDNTNTTAAACAQKCTLTKGCLAFEIYQQAPKACYIFLGALAQPFSPNVDSFTCVRSSSHKPAASAGFQLGNGTFLLNGAPIRLFAGSLQHFRIHPQHWEHRLALAKAMGLNAVQTLVPWMMMEPTPGEFVTEGFTDIVKFAKMAHAAGLLVVLRPGPFICDGPDYGGFPWWLTQQNTPASVDDSAPGALLKVRTADPAFLARVDLFLGKVFALLRAENLTADMGGPIIMAQIDNEYGLFGSDQEYLQHLRATVRAGLGDGVVIHSTDPADPHTLDGSRTPGVLQTVDFGFGDPARSFAILKNSQALVSKVPQPLMVSEIYPGYLTYIGGSAFPIIYDPATFANFVDQILDTEHCGGSTSFALWLFASCTDFGFWGGTLWDYKSTTMTLLTPSYDMGAPVDEAGVVRPSFHLLQQVLKKHGATVGPLPPQPPVIAYGTVNMTRSVPLWAALAVLNPNPVRSSPVRTMEELGQGYGYILYTAPVPKYMAGHGAGGVELAGMRDRALVYLDRGPLYQTCHRAPTVDGVVCGAAATQSIVHETIDILVENQGRVTGGLTGTELPWRGISRYAALQGQMLANWTITTLPLDNVEALLPLWRSTIPSPNDSTPTFFSGQFTIAPGKLADTFLNMFGWQKGQAWVNGNNLARYTAQGPQFTFYCPAGFLNEGNNEVVLFETGDAPADFTVEFKAAHTVMPVPSPPQVCPSGFSPHAPGLWSNPEPCGHYPAPANCTTQDLQNNTVPLCAHKCTSTAKCVGFELFGHTSCWIFVGELQLPFISNDEAFTCVRQP